MTGTPSTPSTPSRPSGPAASAAGLRRRIGRGRRARTALLFATAGTLVAPMLAAGGNNASAVEREHSGDVTTDVEIIAKQFDWSVEDTAGHMATQAAFGQLINRIALENPAIFAGAEFASEPGATSQVMVKGSTPSAIAKQVEASGLAVEIIDQMRYSEVDQQKRSAEIIAVLREQGHGDVVTAILPTGEIQVSVGKGPAFELPRSLRDGVKVAQAPGKVSVDETAMGGLQVYSGGGQCTSGFSVRRISNGTTGIATAAHCTGMNMINVVGPDASMSFQGQHNGSLGDVEWHTTSDVEIDNYMASPTDERDVSVVWPSNGYATNMITCVHSRMQGTRSCDRIYSTSVSSNGAGSLIATDNDNTVGGDSGGPWSFNTIADGIHKGDKWIWFGTRNVFSRAALLPAALGVEVMT